MNSETPQQVERFDSSERHDAYSELLADRSYLQWRCNDRELTAADRNFWHANLELFNDLLSILEAGIPIDWMWALERVNEIYVEFVATRSKHGKVEDEKMIDEGQTKGEEYMELDGEALPKMRGATEEVERLVQTFRRINM